MGYPYLARAADGQLVRSSMRKLLPMHLKHVILTVLASGFLTGWLAGCTPAQTNSIPSPDGRLVLVTTVNTDRTDPTVYLCVKFQILDDSGHILYEEQTRASARMRWTMRWDGNARVVLESSDIGTHVWERGSDGRWQKVP